MNRIWETPWKLAREWSTEPKEWFRWFDGKRRWRLASEKPSDDFDGGVGGRLKALKVFRAGNAGYVPATYYLSSEHWRPSTTQVDWINWLAGEA